MRISIEIASLFVANAHYWFLFQKSSFGYKSRGSPRFLKKPSSFRVDDAEVVREKLQCADAVELKVLGFMNHTHAPLADLPRLFRGLTAIFVPGLFKDLVPLFGIPTIYVGIV